MGDSLSGLACDGCGRERFLLPHCSILGVREGSLFAKSF